MLTKDIKLKAIIRLRFCVVMACILSGMLAGNSIELYLVRVPVWRKIDITMWAEFSRQTYHGTGFYIHQVEAGLCFIVLFISSVMCVKNGLRFVSKHIYFATFMSLAGIVVTFFTAPLMFNLSDSNNDPALLQKAFDEVHYIGAYRAVAQILSFFTCIWALGRCFVIKYVRI